MIGHEPRYPCAVTNSSATDGRALNIAYRWVRGRQRPGQKILLWVPLKSNLQHNAQAELISRAADVVVGTSRGSRADGWSQGPVLGLWHDTEDLARMPTGRPTALCIVPWVPERLVGWVRAVQPEILGDGRDWQSANSRRDLHPVVERGLEEMTASINHGNPISVGYDKRDVVEILLALHDAGYDLPGEVVQSWALAHGWNPRNSNRLAEFAETIAHGGRPRISGPVRRPDMVQRWKEEVSAAVNP